MSGMNSFTKEAQGNSLASPTHVRIHRCHLWGTDPHQTLSLLVLWFCTFLLLELWISVVHKLSRIVGNRVVGRKISWRRIINVLDAMLKELGMLASQWYCVIDFYSQINILCHYSQESSSHLLASCLRSCSIDPLLYLQFSFFFKFPLSFKNPELYCII
jgi:hypothetical protein